MRLPFAIFFLIIISFSVTGNLFSQQFHTTSIKALRLYREGVTAFDYVDFQGAEQLLKQALSIDNKFYEAQLMLGDLMLKQRRYAEAAGYYQTAVKIDSTFYMPVFYSLATSELMTGNYSHALVHYKVYISQKNTSDKNRADAEKNIKNCEFAIEAVKKPVPFSPVNIGEGINTSDNEYWPSITADGQTLMFTRQSRSGTRLGNEDFYISHLSNGRWQTAVNAGSPLNTPQNEGAQTLSSDGHYMYFTSCDRAGGLGSCDLYFSAFNNGRWSLPVNLGAPVNTVYWESQPSVSSDGKTLYFSSNRPGGFGGKDLWKTTMKNDGTWSVPVNLGSMINTPGDEMSPFIHFDGKTLYFSSDGRPGMGGFDIYVSRLKNDSVWSEPQNLGYPINTFNDEMGLVIESGGQKAYFSSARDQTGGKNIYSFNLYESIRPEPVSYVKGNVTDRITGQKLTAEYELVNLSTSKIILRDKTDSEGNFLACLPSGVNYGLNISSNGYLFYSDNFMLKGEHPVAKPYLIRISLSPMKIGEKMLLSNIFYEVDSWDLEKESVSELNKLSDLLKNNKSLIVEIGGYTDATGTDEHNQTLSEKRALSVVNYLINNGIDSKRLRHRGYGNKSPVSDNITVEGRRLNRRTEVQIVDFTK
ncbi:MAG: OmpA family protein [Bacteroidota bacterium]|nr:OmpA family protein [Bacteroidota bacterium]